MTKPVIGISGSVLIDQGGIFPGYHRSYVNEDYVDSVVQNDGIPLIIPFNADDEVISAQLDQVEALILSGGHDVDPRRYNEQPLGKLGQTWPARDHFDTLLLKLAEEKQIPVLGICRGLQIINVAHGGSLYQDLSYRKELTLKHSQDHTPDLPTHGMKVEADSRLAKILGQTEFDVNSFHHQIIKDVAPDLRAVATSPDGVVEALESENEDLIAVQWHPEMLHRNADVAFMNNLFKWLIKTAR